MELLKMFYYFLCFSILTIGACLALGASKANFLGGFIEFILGLAIIAVGIGAIYFVIAFAYEGFTKLRNAIKRIIS